MITEVVRELLAQAEFIDVGTCDIAAHPAVAPKVLLKYDGSFIYLADYVVSRTYENLRVNPMVSLALMDREELYGYQLNGLAEVISRGELYEQMVEQLRKKEVELSVKRIIEGVSRGKGHEASAIGHASHFAIYKIKIEEIVQIGPRGNITRERV